MLPSKRAVVGFFSALLLLLVANSAKAQTAPTGLNVIMTETSPDPSYPFTFVWFWNDNSGGADSVEIDYSYTGATGSFSSLTTIAPGESNGAYELELISFAVGTKLYFQVRDFQGSSYSAPTNTFAITVPASVFTTPSNVQASDVDDGSISVTWADGNTSEYGAEIWATSASGVVTHAQDVYFYQSKQATITGLAPGTGYHFNVRGFRENSAGARTYTAFSANSNTATTLGLLAPSGLTTYTPPITTTPGATGTSVTLNWTDNSSAENCIAILQRPTGTGPFTVVQVLPATVLDDEDETVPNTSVTLTGLPAGTSLDFAVEAGYGTATTSSSSAMCTPATQITEDAITSPHYANAVMGQTFTYIITTSTAHGTPTIAVTGLPDTSGLTWDGNVTISGQPTTEGVIQASITATYPDGWSDNPYLAIRVLNPPVVASTISTQTVTVGIPASSVVLSGYFSDPEESSAVQVATSLGNMNFIMSDAAAQQTVANFRAYINNGTYLNNLFHRSIADFVIQAGNFKPGATPNFFNQPATLPPVVSEYSGVSNTVGTVAMALTSSGPGTGTDQFFVNLENNGLSPTYELDDQEFTVFARVANGGMQVANAIAAVPTGNYNIVVSFPVVCETSKGSVSVTVASLNNIAVGDTVTGTGVPAGATVASLPTSGNAITLSAAVTVTSASDTLTFAGTQQFSNWPLNTANAPLFMNNTQDVSITSITPVSVFNYSTSFDTPGVASAAVTNGNLVVTAVAPGSTNLTLTATDLDGNPVSQTFSVTVNPSSNATLSSLAVSSGSLSPVFSSGATSYAVTVPAGTTSITVIPTVSQAPATVLVNNTAVTSGQASGAISLPANATTPITIQVTAQDGATTDTYTLEVTRPLATTVAASAVTAGYATLNGSANPNGQPTTAYFQYGTSASYGLSTGYSSLGSGSTAVPVSFNINSLAKGTTYHYRLVVVSGGTTYYGADQTFTTTTAVSPATWHSTQVTSLTNPNLNNMADGARTGAAHSSWEVYFYKGIDSNIWCVYLSGSTWTQEQLTTNANVSDWLAFESTYLILCYKSNDGNLWCVYYNGTKWVNEQLGTLPQGVTIAGDIVVDTYGGWNNVYYRGSDSHLYAAYFNGTSWVHVAIGGTATVKGNLAVEGNNHLVYYQSTDNNIWCFHYTGSGSVWEQIQLTSTGNVGGTVAVDSVGLTVYYKSLTDTSAWCTYSTGGPTWTPLQLDASANMSSSPTSFSNIAPYTVFDDTLYLDNNGQCDALYYNGSKWGHILLGDGGSNLTSGLSLQPYYHWAFARHSDGNVIIFYNQ